MVAAVEPRVAGWEGLAQAAAALRARDLAVYGADEHDEEALAAEWRLPGFDPAGDAWLVGAGATPLGAAYLLPTGRFDGAVLPEARGRGIGTALVAAVERRACERGIPELETFPCTRDAGAGPLLRAHGFRLGSRVLRMTRPLASDEPPAQLPSGVRVRTYRAEDGPAVHALLERCYTQPGERMEPYEIWHAWMTEGPDFDPSAWFLAEDEERLVGAVLLWPFGWVKDLVVGPELRRRGLGEALLRIGFRDLAARGAREVGLKADETNPTGAVRLYERVGFAVDRVHEYLVKALDPSGR